MKAKDYYTQDLELDFDKGEIYWEKGRGGRKAGSRAGTVCTDPRCGKQYRQIGINGKLYREHRLLYCFFHKDSFNEFDIDHIDQNSLNNAIDNLRHVTRSENQRNKKKQSNNTSGLTGVRFHKASGKWVAEIKVDGERIHLGLFDTQKEAEAVRLAANIEHNYHENHGK